MTARISLALTLHNHQPVGNFGWVIGEVFERAYEPMVGALERHPGVRVALHYTAPLLEWLDANQPEFLDRLRALVARGQVEIVGGAHFEPILASLPERDRLGQLLRMRTDLERRFGVSPRGAWLAERVWEPSLPSVLADAGYTYTVLDDNHLRGASVPEDEMWGTYTTDDQGRLLIIFGTEKGLRYRIPWHPVPELISYLREAATEDGERVGIMGDDGEKFGGWPGTDELSWGKEAWVDKCFSALEENSDWLTTVTPSDWMAAHPPIGRVYVPTASYVEMTEWVLPPDEAPIFGRLLHDAVETGSPAARFLRGGMWRNFAARYREVNDLHKQMLRVSNAVAAMPAGPERGLALDHLHQGQSNDCYWHGLFGGIYIGHMRAATHEHLIAAEDLAEGAVGVRTATALADLDMDGADEVRLADEGQVVTVDLGEGAGIGGWDIRPVRHALTSVMRRRPEAYHAVLRAHPGARPEDGESSSGDGVTSIHDTFRVKEPGLVDLLVYDAYERRSFLVRALSPEATPDDWAMARAPELGDALDGAFVVVDLGTDRVTARRDASIAGAAVTVTKTIILGGDRRSPTLECQVMLEHRDGPAIDVRLGVEWSLTMLGGGGNPAAWWEVDGRRTGHDLGGQAGDVNTLSQGNDYIGVAVATSVDAPTEAWWAPIETVSNSESGYERVYQGASLLLSWPLRLAAGERWGRTIRHAVATAHDRTAEGA